jgi:hypothetical protein
MRIPYGSSASGVVAGNLSSFTEAPENDVAIPQQQLVLAGVDHSLPITYQLVRGHFRYPVGNETIKYACRNPTSWEALDDRMELPPSNPFDFGFSFQTRLNILIMGDSLALQFGSWLQAAGGGRTNKTTLQWVDWKADGFHEGLAVAPVAGGGTIAYWRILDFWSKRALHNKMGKRGKGWRKHWVRAIRNDLKTKGDKYNVLIFRISHPWISYDGVTEGGLNETIQVAKEYLGQPLVVIFQTAPFNNNVVTSEDLVNFHAMNNVVRSFVTKLNASDVLMSDVETYMENVIEWNAKSLGMDTTNATSFMLEKIPLSPRKPQIALYHPHVAQVCAEPVRRRPIGCRSNMLSNDGIHPCMESLGARIFANWACLIQCAYGTTQNIRQCESGCNNQYFRLDKPLPGVHFVNTTKR